MPSRGLKRTNRLRFVNIAQRTCAPSSFNVKYQCPEPGARRFEISPSTHTSGKRSSSVKRTAPVNSLTVRIGRSLSRASIAAFYLNVAEMRRSRLHACGARVGSRVYFALEAVPMLRIANDALTFDDVLL